MMHKLIFTVPFLPCLQSLAALPPWLLYHVAIKLAVAPTQPTSSCMISNHLPASFPMAEEKERQRNRSRKQKGELSSLWGVVSTSPLVHGGLRLDHIRGHARALAKPRESGLYDSSGVSYLSCARRSCVLYFGGGICRGVHGILCSWIRCAITLISPLLAAILWLGAASLDSFADPAYGGLHDTM
jgi:hypothetical protein